MVCHAEGFGTKKRRQATATATGTGWVQNRQSIALFPVIAIN